MMGAFHEGSPSFFIVAAIFVIVALTMAVLGLFASEILKSAAQVALQFGLC